jgi:hypothetical protein
MITLTSQIAQEQTVLSQSNFAVKSRKLFSFPVFLLANIRGGLSTKLDELQVLLTDNNVDFAILTESWLHADITSDTLQISGYTMYRLDRRDGRQGGGVVVYVKEGTVCSHLAHFTHDNLEVLWLLYRANSMPREVTHLLVGAVYHPPRANNFELADYLTSTMDQVTRSHPNAGILLLGDFNQLSDSYLKSFPLQQIVTSATRATSILDKVFTNVSSWYKTPVILPAVSRSDHETVLLQPVADPPRPSKSVKVLHRRLISPNRKALLCHHLQNVNWTPLFHMNTCEQMVSYFYSVVIKLLDCYMPFVRTSVSNLDKPWVTKTFKSLIKQRQRAFLSSSMSQYRKLRNKVQRMALSLRKQFYSRKIESLHSADPRSWWKKTKQFLYDKQSNPLQHLEQPNADQSLADVINDFFISVSAHIPPFDKDLLTGLTADHNHTDQYIIEPSEVERRLSRINIHKSSGPDGLPNWLLRDFASLLSEPLSAIFNASLREGYLPPIWKSAEVVPVPKTQPPISIQNDLRPISLLPTVAKVFESIVGRWLLSFVEPFLDNCQFGCRKGRSTLHALVAILHEWMSCLDSGGSVRTVFVDFRKAFDLVDHNVLFTKLLKYQLPNFMLKWFSSYLSNRYQRVRADHHLSSWKELNGAMPQGSWLGPLCFLVLIDDLSVDCPVHKYVDDTTLSELLQSKHQHSSMPSFLDHLLSWADSNRMEINATKTKEMILGPLARTDMSLLTIPAGIINRVTSFKLLGVYIDSNLSWSTHIDHMVKRATGRLYFLKQLKRAGVASQHLLHFYTTVIRPVLEYCAPLWHYALTKAHTEQLEAVQKRAIHIIFNYSRGMPYNFMLYAAELPSLSSRRLNLSSEFFLGITDPDSCLHHLLPDPRPDSVTARLRTYEAYPRVATRTKRYCSFIQYSLNHYQISIPNC